MSIILRPFQRDVVQSVYDAWHNGSRATLLVSATGSGKTVMFSDIVRNHNGASCVIAHRHELVSQISIALARNGVRHRIIGQATTISACRALHLAEIGTSYYDRNARCAVAGVDTLVRMSPDDTWMHAVTLVVQDECHHVLSANKWGKAMMMFPNARILGVSATPSRSDGKGLGVPSLGGDGIFDNMVLAPSMRDLINMGYLCDYRVFAPPSDLDLSGVSISASGDYSPEPLRNAVHKSHIVGDVVDHYLRVAPGKLGVTFSVDVEAATEQAAAYRQAGVPAEVVSAKTPPATRYEILRRFGRGELKQLTNVDLFGEGFDLPAIEVVSMGRPTQSYALFVQQFGRALRLKDGKTHALILDHVGNTMRHGLPDAHREWSLAGVEKQGRSKSQDIMQVRTCQNCTGVYERIEGLVCPYCSHTAVPPTRSGAQHVDGDLYELNEETLTRMRGEIDKPPAYHPDTRITMSINARHRERAEMQSELRTAMGVWAASHDTGTDEATVRRLQRKFYLSFGIDVLSAQALGRADAEKLLQQIVDKRNNAR